MIRFQWQLQRQSAMRFQNFRNNYILHLLICSKNQQLGQHESNGLRTSIQFQMYIHWKLKLQKLLKTPANFSTRSYKQTNRQINPFGAPPSYGFPPLLSNVRVITHQGPKSLLLLFTLSANCKLVERALDVRSPRQEWSLSSLPVLKWAQ